MFEKAISFYTFQTLSYSIDVYKREIEPVKSLWDFGCYVTFFPQLVAGPIVRAKSFIPQLNSAYLLSRKEFKIGVWWILTGLIKKVVFADYIAMNLVDRVFASPTSYSGMEVMLGLYGYSLQVFADFSGYSDIAIGVAWLMGFNLPKNFDYKNTQLIFHKRDYSVYANEIIDLLKIKPEFVNYNYNESNYYQITLILGEDYNKIDSYKLVSMFYEPF